MRHAFIITGWVVATAVGLGIADAADGPTAAAATPDSPVVVVPASRHDVSPPLREQPASPVREAISEHREPSVPEGLNRLPDGWNGTVATRSSQLFNQSSPGLSGPMPAFSANSEGLGAGFAGYSITGVPPDTTGAVGADYYMQWVNSHFVLFHKDGSVVDLSGNDWRAGSSIWSGFGGPCQNSNDGDPVVLYDQLAGRWMMSQFALNNYPTGPFYQCFAVSTTGDPLGTWNRYQFEWPSSYLNDYPKIGLWPDGYYMTVNQFQWNSSISNFNWKGGAVAVFDRAKMVLGQAATMQYWNLGVFYGALLPADLDGSTPPPAAAPGLIFGLGSNAIQMWLATVDWATPGNSHLSSSPDVTVPIGATTNSASIDQPGTTSDLYSIGNQLMYRAPYRNLGDHEAVVLTQSTGATSGISWYELRGLSTTPTLHQEGRYQPDSDERWMGSIAMDAAGNIAVGYSVSGAALSPSIRVVGREAGDPAGQMTFDEATVTTGSGHQNPFGGDNRWGDYSTMAIDPTDDCTFWYTQEYVAGTGQFIWRTRVAAFRFPSCNPTSIFGDDFEGGTTGAWSSTTP
jgi:hypothetical protein